MRQSFVPNNSNSNPNDFEPHVNTNDNDKQRNTIRSYRTSPSWFEKVVPLLKPILTIVILILTLYFLFKYWRDLKELLSIFLGSAVIGIIAIAWLTRGHALRNGKSILAIGCTSGVIGLILSTNLLSINNTIDNAISYIIPFVIVVIGIKLVLHSIR